MDDDARQDEDHADDSQEVGSVFRAKPVMPGVLSGYQVHGHVESTRRHHEEQPNAAQYREAACLDK